MGYLVAGFMRLATWLGVQFCVEQPDSSSLEHFPPFCKAVQMTMAMRVHFHMGAFDEAVGCQKPMKLFSNTEWATITQHGSGLRDHQNSQGVLLQTPLKRDGWVYPWKSSFRTWGRAMAELEAKGSDALARKSEAAAR